MVAARLTVSFFLFYVNGNFRRLPCVATVSDSYGYPHFWRCVAIGTHNGRLLSHSVPVGCELALKRAILFTFLLKLRPPHTFFVGAGSGNNLWPSSCGQGMMGVVVRQQLEDRCPYSILYILVLVYCSLVAAGCARSSVRFAPGGCWHPLHCI